MPDVLELLRSSAGEWRGASILQDPESGIHEECLSTATVTPLLGGKFVRLDYTWSYRDKPQEGSLLVGADAKAGLVTVHWIDSWHMGTKVMACTGTLPNGRTLGVRGTYAAPPGPDWGWRIDITPDERSKLGILMFNVTPDGQEAEAVRATYSRVAAGSS